MAPEKLSDDRIKHLEMIQTVIARLGNDGFLVKGWSITVTTVLFGLAVNSKRPLLAVVAVLPIFAFWILDTYYLRAERLFRELYEQTRTDGSGYELFKMDATSESFIKGLNADRQHVARWWNTAWRPTLVWLYCVLAVGAIPVALLAQK
jgi:hypothetical protein